MTLYASRLHLDSFVLNDVLNLIQVKFAQRYRPNLKRNSLTLKNLHACYLFNCALLELSYNILLHDQNLGRNLLITSHHAGQYLAYLVNISFGSILFCVCCACLKS